MEHKTRLGGWEFHLEQNSEGIRLQIQTSPEHQEARQEIFQQIDQLRDNARQVGVSGFELMGHYLKSRWDSMTKKG